MPYGFIPESKIWLPKKVYDTNGREAPEFNEGKTLVNSVGLD